MPAPLMISCFAPLRKLFQSSLCPNFCNSLHTRQQHSITQWQNTSSAVQQNKPSEWHTLQREMVGITGEQKSKLSSGMGGTKQICRYSDRRLWTETKALISEYVILSACFACLQAHPLPFATLSLKFWMYVTCHHISCVTWWWNHDLSTLPNRQL